MPPIQQSCQRTGRPQATSIIDHQFFDVAIVGAGPAGSTCAILCASAGMRTLLLDRAAFPRDKVCGDCLNPGCWPVFDQLAVTAEILAAPHTPLSRVTFVSARRRSITVPLESPPPGEIAITRRILDSILLHHARQSGADVRESSPILSLRRNGAWHLETPSASFTAHHLIAADGRNSTVARLLRIAPPARRGRVALQTHAPSPVGDSIELHLMPDGYCGIAPVGNGLANFCLVAAPSRIDRVKALVSTRFSLPRGQPWQAVTPLERAPIGPLNSGVIFIGDAGRVVEPFTGEGIYYALHTASLAAQHLASGALEKYPAAHSALYRRRLWINRLARHAVMHPHAGAFLLRLTATCPAALRYLVRKVTFPPPSLAAPSPSPIYAPEH